MHLKESGRRDFFSRGQRGYTLIEMAISIIVVGVLAAPALGVYANYKTSQQRQTTLSNIQYVVDAIHNYRTANGTYPCPAPLNLPRTDASYGTDLCFTGAVTTAVPGPNACGAGAASGVCVETSTRDPTTEVPAGAALTAAEKRVVVGGVPFRQLQLDENKTYDGYGSRIVYAITQSETDINTINDLKGGIAIQSALAGQSLTSPPNSAVFVVFSPGPTKVGGWTADNAVSSKCTGAVGLDVQNCNKGFEGGAAAANPLFIYSYENSAPGANFYDDQMSYFSSHTDPLWARVPGAPSNYNDIHDLTTGGVGIGTNVPYVQPVAPLWAAKMDIVSTGTNNALLAFGTNGVDGKIFADMICDETGVKCFDPKVIGGSNAAGEGMLCAGGSNKFMTGIAAGGAVCSFIRIGCGNGPNYVLMGFDAAGLPVCGPPPNPACAASSATPPGGGCPSVPLPAAGDTATQSFGPLDSAAGGCRHVTYTCGSSIAGAWSLTSNDGNLCSFVSVCTPTPGIACSLGFAGAYTSTSCTNCGAAPTVATTQATDCVCTGGTFPDNQACAAPFTGGTMSCTITYAAGTCSTPGPVCNPSTAGCGCGLPPTTPVACGVGYDPGMMTSQALDPATCTYTGPISYAGCSCSKPPTSLQPASCPPLQIGWDTCTRQSDCTWGACVLTTPCACNPAGWPQLTSSNHDCASPTPVVYANGNECYKPDPLNLDQVTTNQNPGTCLAGATSTVWGACIPKSFTWKETGVNGNTGTPDGSSIYETDSCSCTDHMNTLAAPTICYIHGDTNNTMYYCKCY